MKKIIAIISLAIIIALPYFLPMPVMTSGLVAQYALGETIEFNVTAWNISPLAREAKDQQATDIVLKINGTPVASTKTSAPVRVRQFSRVEQKVSYTISKQQVDTPGFDSATGQVLLPPGKHKLSVEWLGSSSLASSVRIIEL